jgi:hypothetical protein
MLPPVPNKTVPYVNVACFPDNNVFIAVVVVYDASAFVINVDTPTPACYNVVVVLMVIVLMVVPVNVLFIVVLFDELLL